MSKPVRVVILALVPLIPLAFFVHHSFRSPAFRAVVDKALAAAMSEPPCNVAPNRRFTVDYFGMTYFGDTSALIDRTILCRGLWGEDELRFLTDAVAISGPDSIFLDVGANSGAYSLFMSRHAGVVHAFDPFEPVLERFRNSVTTSGLSNIVIHPVGLGEADAQLPFEEPPADNTGTGSFVPGLMEFNSSRGLTLTVVAGDAYFERQGIARVDVFKVDTEGFEKSVLRGLSTVLARSRPVGTLEFTHRPGFEHLFQSEQELRDSLPERYSLFTLRSREGGYELTPFAADFSRDYFHQETLAVIPDEAISRFESSLRSRR